MESITVPKITVSFAVDLEVEYNAFEGRTASELAIALQDDLDDLLFELSPKVKGVFTSITAVDSND